jgi:hypothetical protein
MQLHRRAFVAGAVGIGFGTTTTVSAQPDPYDMLIAGQYANKVKFLEQAGGLFIGPNLQLTSNSTDWLLKLGRYIGREHGQPVDWHGYWIFRPDARLCWQAVNSGGGALDFWNRDGKAAGDPEDFELFNFIPVSKPQKTVKIQAIHGYFVGLVGNTFNCSEHVDHAAIFTVQFG